MSGGVREKRWAWSPVPVMQVEPAVGPAQGNAELGEDKVLP